MLKKRDKLKAPYQSTQLLMEIAKSDPATAADILGTDMGGLLECEAQNRLAKYGRNEVAHEKVPAWYWQFLLAFHNPFIYVLLALGIISLVTGDREAAIVVSVMVGLSAVIRFWQEFRSQAAAEKLKAMVRTTAAVLRRDSEGDGNGKRELPIEEIVPGDIVLLSAGDMVPADVRLLSSKDLFVSQSALTGEALPVEKYDDYMAIGDKSSKARKQGVEYTPLEMQNLCFMGTNIVSGTATAVVVATGERTHLGALAKGILGKREETSFDRGVNQVTWLLIKFMLVMAPVIFLLNGFTKGDWTEAFFFAIAVAVGLTPEMLPMIVTANLAKGAVKMSKKKVIVKRLNAIQNMGAMNILCTDKTGTLTEDKVVLVRHLNADGKECDRVLDLAYLNSCHQTGLKNLIDQAVIERREDGQLAMGEKRFEKIDEIPFDFGRRRMSVVVADEANKHLLVCKGAVEEMLAICTTVEKDGRLEPITEAIRTEVLRLSKELNEEGMRVIAVAYKEGRRERAEYTVDDESDLVLAGYIGFLDPPKPSAAAAIQTMKEHGVEVKILTGDNEVVTRKVCKEVGIDPGRPVLGHEIESLNDAQLAELAEQTTVFAKLSPLQKSRVIKILQSKGHTVGYMGDGINDAAALRVADVGISVDSAADIAKESSEIILLEKSLAVLEEGIIEGRTTFGNILKYMKMTASSNFGNVFSILAASAFIPFLPMLALHLLIQNLLYDLSQLSIPWDKMDKEFLVKPRKWDVSNLRHFIIWIGPISSVFDIITFIVMWNVFQANTVEQQALFHSGWFVVGLLTQTLIVHMIRTEKIPFMQSVAAAPVLLLTAVIMAVGIYIPFSPLGEAVGLPPLPLSYFPWLAGILLGYALLTQFFKKIYMKKFHSWL
ncbi:magnesium-translocating P-type ATPase [Brevibacillus sp. B_LB10_24]|uniref:magnesium-translocating P-type ATPase n=1 Tax=Brevibacillus sp. B_LB10_24 TaxID=3380645 RepID=UPI0038B7CEEA